MKYVAAGLLNLTVLALVMLGKTDAQIYIVIVVAELGAMGIHVGMISGSNLNTVPVPAALPVPVQP
jgi:hypothetical protein